MIVGRARTLAVSLLVAGLCSYVLLLLADTALHKQFWVDEGFEVVQVCGRPAGQMLLQGSFGCSPAPLFSMAHRLVVRSVEPLGLSMRLTYRALSLVAATVALLVLLFGLQHRLGLPAALIAFATLAADQGFHHYAEQNRAYITWVMATAVLVVTTAELCVRDEMRLRKRVALLLGAGLLTGLSALPGCGQAAAAFAAFWLFHRWRRPATPVGGKATLALLCGAAAIVALDLHYWSGSVCRGWGGADELGLDFLGGSDHWTMARTAAGPLWPPGTGVWVWLARGLLVLGALAPLRWWFRRAQLGPNERFVVALWQICLLQLLVAVPVALGLIASRYLFLPRMFLFVLVPRAVLSAVAFWAIVSWVREKLGTRAAPLASSLAWTASAAATAVALWQADRIGRPWRFPFPPVGEISCASLKAPEVRLLRPTGSPDAFRLNFLVRLGRALDACAGVPPPSDGPRYLLARDASNQPDWFQVVSEAPTGYEPLAICGEAVTLESGRVHRE